MSLLLALPFHMIFHSCGPVFSFFSVPVYENSKQLFAFTFQINTKPGRVSLRGFVDSPAPFPVVRDSLGCLMLPQGCCLISSGDDLLLPAVDKDTCTRVHSTVPTSSWVWFQGLSWDISMVTSHKYNIWGSLSLRAQSNFLLINRMWSRVILLPHTK